MSDVVSEGARISLEAVLWREKIDNGEQIKCRKDNPQKTF